jgi:Transposase, Mutator family
MVALADGYRESSESWADLLRGCAHRGMRAPVLAAGDGARGFWTALREVFPETREQRRWFHKTANVLAALPRSAHPGAKKALAEIWGAEDKDTLAPRRRPSTQPTGRSSLRPPRRSPTIRTSCSRSTTTRARTGCTCARPTRSSRPSLPSGTRTKVTKGPGSRAARLAMAFKLIQAARDHWRMVNAPHLVALVRAGARLERGVLTERHEEAAA